MKTQKIVSTILLVIASATLVWVVLGYISADNYIRKTRYLVANFPIEFTEGKKFSGSFRVDDNTRYFASIIFFRKIPDEVIDSLIGNIKPARNDNYNGKIKLSFTLFENGSQVHHLDSLTEKSFSYGQDYTGRNITSFECEKNKTYTFTLEAKTTLPGLNKTTPRFIVTINPGFLKQQVVSAEISKLFLIPAIIFFLVSLFIYVAVILFSKYKLNK